MAFIFKVVMAFILQGRHSLYFASLSWPLLRKVVAVFILQGRHGLYFAVDFILLGRRNIYFARSSWPFNLKSHNGLHF
jgi:hypothetical protein